MQDQALVREAHHTTHIEGTQLSLEQSTLLLSGLEVPGADPEDARELLNYRDAFQYVSQVSSQGKQITEDIILRIHELLVKGVRENEASPGRYRERQNWIVDMATMKAVYTPPPPDAVPGLMMELVTWLKVETDIHPVLVAGIAQLQFVDIHPFLDGNGRAARLLSTLCLFNTGYDFKHLFTLSEYYDRDRPAYYRAIQSVREKEMDMTPWLEYFCAGLATQMKEIRDAGEQQIRIELLSRTHDLSGRQRSLLRIVFDESESNIQDFEKRFPDVNRRTLQRDLRKLVEIGIVETRGQTNQLKYLLKEKT
jgi:Fic family protein